MSQQSINDPGALKVWAAVLLCNEEIGIRNEEIQRRTELSCNTVECLLDSLVALGFVSFKLTQTGTGGTQSRFYRTKDDISLHKQ